MILQFIPEEKTRLKRPIFRLKMKFEKNNFTNLHSELQLTQVPQQTPPVKNKISKVFPNGSSVTFSAFEWLGI